MRQPASKKKKLDYPWETEGGRLAAKVRKMANKLTPVQRRAHFNAAMVKVYGGQPKKATGIGC